MCGEQARERACMCKCVSVGNGQVRASAGDFLNGQQQSMSDLGGRVVKVGLTPQQRGKVPTNKNEGGWRGNEDNK